MANPDAHPLFHGDRGFQYTGRDFHRKLEQAGISISDILCDNNAYSALQCADGLIMTGPTGTNVNDVSVLLIRR